MLHNNGTISVRAKGRGGGGGLIHPALLSSSVENANKGIDATDPFPLPTRIRSSLFASLPVTNYTCGWQEAQCVTTTQLPGQGLNPDLSEIQRAYSHHIKRGVVFIQSFFYSFVCLFVCFLFVRTLLPSRYLSRSWRLRRKICLFNILKRSDKASLITCPRQNEIEVFCFVALANYNSLGLKS